MTNGNGGPGGAVRDAQTDRARLRAVHDALTGGDIATAGKLAEDAFRDGIDHVMVLSLVAGRREQEGRLDHALALLRRARAAAPGAAGIANQLGLALLRMERVEEAAASFHDALTLDPAFPPALANRGMASSALGFDADARRDFEAALALDPANLVALNGLAASALARGEADEARRLADSVLAREPGFPVAMLTRAGADVALGEHEAAEARLRPLLGDARVAPLDRAAGWGLLGDALDGEGRFAEAFAAWREGNEAQLSHYRAAFEGRPGTLALVRRLASTLEGRRIPAAFGHGGRSPAARHVFLLGFPGAGGEALAGLLADPVILEGCEALIDAARDWMADEERFIAFLEADDNTVEPARVAYWRRVGEEGVDPAGRLFVDCNPLNLFKLPLIARLFPDAHILIVRGDARDDVLAAYAARFRMSAPAWQMLTLEGCAELHVATVALVEASRTAFGLFMHETSPEAAVADPAGEAKAIADFLALAVPDSPAVRPVPRPGRWRDYEAQLAPVVETVAP